jgi:hypothetical protein
MSNVRKSDYEKIVKIYNESGNKAALEYLQQNFGVKYPRDVITRIKKTPGYFYDPVTKKFNVKLENSEGAIFMGIEELCKPLSTDKAETNLSIEVSTDLNINIIYQELLQEKFMELTKYVKLNGYLNKISIDKTSLIANGYKVFMH